MRSEWSCDRCGVEVPDGEGHYVGDDRVCAECFTAEEEEQP